MVNTFANGLRIAAQKRKPIIGTPGVPPRTIDPVRPQPVADVAPMPGLNPRPPTESGFPTPDVISGAPPAIPQQVRPPSLIQDTLRRRRELEI